MKKYVFLTMVLMFLVTIESYPQLATYPSLTFEEIAGTKRWRVYPDYPNPSPLRIPLSDATMLEYTVLGGYETNFRSGPDIIDVIAKKMDRNNNNLNLAWLIHDINYEGYLGDRKVADMLLYSMLLWANLSHERASAVYYGVRFFGKSHYQNGPRSTRIKFRRVDSDVPFWNTSSWKALPNFGIQKMRLENSVVGNDDLINREIRELFPKDAEQIIREAKYIRE